MGVPSDISPCRDSCIEYPKTDWRHCGGRGLVLRSSAGGERPNAFPSRGSRVARALDRGRQHRCGGGDRNRCRCSARNSARRIRSRRALLYVSGLGQYEFRINGAKVGDRRTHARMERLSQDGFLRHLRCDLDAAHAAPMRWASCWATACTGFSRRRGATQNSPARLARRSASPNCMSSSPAAKAPTSSPTRPGKRMPAPIIFSSHLWRRRLRCARGDGWMGSGRLR